LPACLHDRAVADDTSRSSSGEITVVGKGRKTRTVKISHAVRALDRYLRAGTRHVQAPRAAVMARGRNRGPMTTSGLYRAITRRGRQCGLVDVTPHCSGAT
jgi:site-specific recombinase XerC